MANAKDFEIGLDIGHGEDTFDKGGKGVYVNGVGYEEHHFNSAVALVAEKRLKEIGFGVYMAQKPYQKDVPLITRTNRYNSRKVDAVISIHANAGVETANGACVFFWHTAKDSEKLADIWKDNFKEIVKGVDLHGDGEHESKVGSWTNLHICRETNMEAILIEHGFMTNDHDFEYIFGDHKDEYIKQCAETIVKTVCEYFKVPYSKGSGNVSIPKPNVDGKHKVKKGETFTSIAKKYGVSVKDIQRANPKVKPRNIQIGTYLVIPEGKSAPKPSSNKKKPNMKTKSIVTYLNSIGVNSSFSNREKLAKQNGIKGYRGTAEQNLLLLDRLRNGYKAPSKPSTPSRKGNMKTNSIVTYLNSIGVDSSFANRAKLARQHGIEGYEGTAKQNLTLLSKLRSGAKAVKPKGNQTTNSIVDYLNSIGVNASFNNRAKLAKKYGIKGYKGTASQNLQLLKNMRGH